MPRQKRLSQAAYSWCLLANPLRNGAMPMLYCSFLTVLLMHRAKRDEEKCLAKYGAYYEKYMSMVPCQSEPYPTPTPKPHPLSPNPNPNPTPNRSPIP